MIHTITLEDGKYEIDRRDNGIITACRRNGESWSEGFKLMEFVGVFHASLNRIQDLEKPIDMILFCPACGLQHVDGPEQIDRHLVQSDPASGWSVQSWANPPHGSHLCHGCGHIWRPAEVPTNWVKELSALGKNDHQPPVRGCFRGRAEKISVYRRGWPMHNHYIDHPPC